jgi:hypothetical protein
MTVSAEPEEKTEPNRVQKRRDLSFMSFKGEEAFVNANWHALKKEASQKETKTDTFPKKNNCLEMARKLLRTPA